LEQLDIGLGNIGIGWIDKQGYHFRGWQKFVQQFQPLWRNLKMQTGHTCDIAAGPV